MKESKALYQQLAPLPYRIVYETYKNNNWELYSIKADGSNPVNLTNTPNVHEMYPHVSPDGTKICFVLDKTRNNSTVRCVYYMNMDGSDRVLVAEHARQPCWRLDGKTIAYLHSKYDQFHLMKLMNQAVNEVRREEQKQHLELKGSKYLWLKNEWNHSARQQELFQTLRRLDLQTNKAHHLKGVFQDIFTCSAEDGEPAYLNDQPIQVSDPVELNRHGTIIIPSTILRPYTIRYRGRALAFGSAAASLCFVARGKVHGGLQEPIRLYDIAGGAVILKAACGMMKYFSGQDVDLWALVDGRRTPEPYFSGHPKNVEQLLSLFDYHKELAKE